MRLHTNVTDSRFRAVLSSLHQSAGADIRDRQYAAVTPGVIDGDADGDDGEADEAVDLRRQRAAVVPAAGLMPTLGFAEASERMPGDP